MLEQIPIPKPYYDRLVLEGKDVSRFIPMISLEEKMAMLEPREQPQMMNLKFDKKGRLKKHGDKNH